MNTVLHAPENVRPMLLASAGAMLLLLGNPAPLAAEATAPAAVNPALANKGMLQLERIRVAKSGEGFVVAQEEGTGAELVLPGLAAASPETRNLLAHPPTLAEKTVPLALAWDLTDSAKPRYEVGAASYLAARQLLPQTPEADALQSLREYQASYFDIIATVKSTASDFQPRLQQYLHSYAKASHTADRGMLSAAWQGDYEQAAAWHSVGRKLAVERRAIGTSSAQMEKALYGYYDVFKPPSYERLLANLQRVAGFFEGDPSLTLLRGAGIFLGDRVVLTAAHNLRWMRQGESRVVLLRNGAALEYIYRRPLLDASGLDPKLPAYSDLALIEVASVSGQPAATFAPLLLGSDNLDKPVYVLAFHNRDTHSHGVYDNAHVLFPYEVPSERMVSLFRRAYENELPKLPTQKEREEAMARICRELSQAYGYSPKEDRADRTYYFQTTTGGLNRHACFAFDTDTVHGNSGGGVFSKDTGALIGVMVSGRPDNEVVRQPSWDEKEEGIPVVSIRALFQFYERSRDAARDPALDPSLLNP